jgi:hypothetical protein
MTAISVDPPNRWWLESPGHPRWTHAVRAGDPRPHFIASADERVDDLDAFFELPTAAL